MFEIENLPFPPSDNALYRSFRKRVIKSEPYRKFLNELEIFRLSNLVKLNHLKFLVKRTDLLAIEFKFVSPVWRRKDGKLRLADVANRIKAGADSIAHLLEIDDSQFHKVSAEKVDGPEEMKVIIHKL